MGARDRRTWWLGIAMAVAVAIAIPSPSEAGGLKAYKKQKHKVRGPKVTDQSCPAEFTARCRKQCGANVKCANACPAQAGPFCAKRKQKRHRETTKLVAKAVSLGAGFALLGVTSIPWPCPDEKPTAGPRQSWLEPAVIAAVGGGVISDDIQTLATSQTYLATATLRVRSRFLGVSAMYNRLMEGDDYLNELDFGPTFYFRNGIVTFGIQPSILVSTAPDVGTLYGKGMRTWTRVYFGSLMGVLDTMLGKINGQWNYHGRIGAGLRFGQLFATVGIDFRDIVDLTDLDVSTASLQGAMLSVGGRIN